MFLHDTAQLGKLWLSSVFGSFIRDECLSFDSIVIYNSFTEYGAMTETLGGFILEKNMILELALNETGIH